MKKPKAKAGEILLTFAIGVILVTTPFLIFQAVTDYRSYGATFGEAETHVRRVCTDIEYAGQDLKQGGILDVHFRCGNDRPLNTVEVPKN